MQGGVRVLVAKSLLFQDLFEQVKLVTNGGNVAGVCLSLNKHSEASSEG